MPVYKHSVIKRSDGDDFTIWVSNDFTDNILGADDDSAAHDRFRRKYGPSWRVSAKGTINCPDAYPDFGNPGLNWELLWTSQNPFS